jgi:phosphoserine phosphatase
LVENVERRSQPSIASRDLVRARLTALLDQSSSGVLAFDADGTLWSGDVGEDVFHLATKTEAIREPARPGLSALAREHGIASDGGANQLARRLFDAYLSGTLPEREACSMMSWCYAGWTVEELRTHSRRTFEETHLPGRLYLGLDFVFELAKAHGVRVLVVSASPQIVVEEAAAHWGVPADDVVACRPALDGNTILPALDGPVPYAGEKPSSLARRTGGRAILASFGDNVFDFELLRAAALAVAVRPKPGLRARLAELNGVVVLE